MKALGFSSRQVLIDGFVSFLYPTGGGSLSEEEGDLLCFAAPNTQTCLALSELLSALLSHRPHRFVTWSWEFGHRARVL